MTARLVAQALALALAAAGPPALAADMPEAGTKNFTPSPETPSYFAGERGIPDLKPQESAAPARPAATPVEITPRPPAATAEEPARAPPSGLAQAPSYKSRAATARAVRLARLHRLRASRLRRSRAVRLAHARPRHRPTDQR
jgi:hypothetical protein